MGRRQKQFVLPQFPQNARIPVTLMSMRYQNIYELGNDLKQVNPLSGIQRITCYLAMDHLLRGSAEQYHGLTQISAGYLTRVDGG